MGISRLTAMEIYGNQDDIVCECLRKNEKGLFIGAIRRGPGHNGKLLISGPLREAKSKKEAVLYMESLRDSIIEAIKKELDDPESKTAKILKKPAIKTALKIGRAAKNI